MCIHIYLESGGDHTFHFQVCPYVYVYTMHTIGILLKCLFLYNGIGKGAYQHTYELISNTVYHRFKVGLPHSRI